MSIWKKEISKYIEIQIDTSCKGSKCTMYNVLCTVYYVVY